jgi:hypothetical protein
MKLLLCYLEHLDSQVLRYARLKSWVCYNFNLSFRNIVFVILVTMEKVLVNAGDITHQNFRLPSVLL